MPLLKGLGTGDLRHAALCNSLVNVKYIERARRALFRSYPASFLDMKESYKSSEQRKGPPIRLGKGGLDCFEITVTLLRDMLLQRREEQSRAKSRAWACFHVGF